jgi:hypothetical protein
LANQKWLKTIAIKTIEIGIERYFINIINFDCDFEDLFSFVMLRGNLEFEFEGVAHVNDCVFLCLCKLNMFMCKYKKILKHLGLFFSKKQNEVGRFLQLLISPSKKKWLKVYYHN